MALHAALYSLEAVIAESGILPFCIPRASKHTGGFGVGKPFGVKLKEPCLSYVDILLEGRGKQTTSAIRMTTWYLAWENLNLHVYNYV